MPECEKCGRKFKSAQALGGHMSNAHPETKGNGQAPPRPQAEAVAPQQDAGVAGQSPPQAKEAGARKEDPKAIVEPGPCVSSASSAEVKPAATTEAAAPQPQQPNTAGRDQAVSQVEPGAKADSPPTPPAADQAPAMTDGAAPQPQQSEQPAQAQPTAETAGAPEAPPAASPQKGDEKPGGSPTPASNREQAQLPPPAGPPVQAPKPEEETSQAEQIRHYLGLGYTLEQLMKSPFNFKESTVRQEMTKVIAPAGEKPGGPNRLPVVLKAGSGQELISPESIIETYVVPEGEVGKWMLRGFMLYRAAQLAVLTDVEIMKGQSEAQSKALKPIMDIMEQARTDMDAAAQRAKDSNTEIAEVAAAGVGARFMTHMDARFEELKSQKPDIATTPNPMQAMMARTMEMMMTQMTNLLMPGSRTGATPGFVDKRTQGGK